MKKVTLLFLLALLISCNSDDNSQSQTDLLVQKSPWTFDHYEVLDVTDRGSSTMTNQQLESAVNTSLNGSSLQFNQDGSGMTYRNGVSDEGWQWEIEGNQLKLIFEAGDGEFEIYYNLNVTNSSLTKESSSVTYDNVANYEVAHYGKFYLK